MSITPEGMKNVLTYALVLCGSVAAGLIVRYIIVKTLKAAGKKDRGVFFKSLATHTGGPLYVLLPLIAISILVGKGHATASIVLMILGRIHPIMIVTETSPTAITNIG